MAKNLPSVDAVIVGFGWTGAIMAQELTDAGLSVLAIERGRWRDTPTDFAPTFAQDEMHFYQRRGTVLPPHRDAITFRHSPAETALPLREYNSFLPGFGVGGAGVHWNGQTWRFLPSDFVARSHNEERYGPLAPNMTVQDWGVTYDDLEPHYDKFEYLCGVSGKAGNLKGVKQEGGNHFEGSRSREYPNPPLQMTYAPTLFAAAAREAGYNPFPQAAANMSRAYTNPLGATLAPCTYCGFCEKYVCGNYSKASPQTTILPVLMRKKNFTLRTECEVMKVNLDASGQRAIGVTYLDSQGEEWFQPADTVLLCGYILGNVRLMLLSGIGQPYDPATGKGQIGRNYAYQITSSVDMFFNDKYINQFIGAGALGMAIDEFNGDNFDHSGLGFIGGGYMGLFTTNGRPIETRLTPEGTPSWGSKWKKALADNYQHSCSIATHGAVMSHRGNYLSLDPTYRDPYGRPLLRMTFDYTDNEHKMSDYLTDKAAGLAKAMKPQAFKANRRSGPYSTVPYQTTHNTGGNVMGTNPSNSAVNRYLQSWAVPNVFVIGSGAFPQNPGYNPTNTVAALAYFSAEAIKTQYLKNPGKPLVQA
jgi:gluconate 2-dehydrogenase alpha chain